MPEASRQQPSGGRSLLENRSTFTSPLTSTWISCTADFAPHRPAVTEAFVEDDDAAIVDPVKDDSIGYMTERGRLEVGRIPGAGDPDRLACDKCTNGVRSPRC